MGQFRTHYDNLQVSRKATTEVMLAAYRALSLKYDPDRNSGDAKCAEIMSIVNRSFAVLMDASQRRAHDEWIATKEAQTCQGADQRENNQSTEQRSEQHASRAEPPRRFSWRRVVQTATAFPNLSRAVFAIAIILALVIFGSLLPSPKPQPSGLPQYNPTPKETPADWTTDPVVPTTAATPAYMRSATAPNGAPWPLEAGYINGEPLLQSGGLSTVRIDNNRNNDDVFVKLVSINPTKTEPVRQFFIPAHGEFTAKGLAPGEYDVRYENLNDGTLLRTQSFTLEQVDQTDGTRFSATTITLYAVPNGHLVTYPLLPSEFF